MMSRNIYTQTAWVCCLFCGAKISLVLYLPSNDGGRADARGECAVVVNNDFFVGQAIWSGKEKKAYDACDAKKYHDEWRSNHKREKLLTNGLVWNETYATCNNHTRLCRRRRIFCKLVVFFGDWNFLYASKCVFFFPYSIPFLILRETFWIDLSSLSLFHAEVILRSPQQIFPVPRRTKLDAIMWCDNELSSVISCYDDEARRQTSTLTWYLRENKSQNIQYLPLSMSEDWWCDRSICPVGSM